jgi:hypothetical protein
MWNTEIYQDLRKVVIESMAAQPCPQLQPSLPRSPKPFKAKLSGPLNKKIRIMEQPGYQ